MSAEKRSRQQSIWTSASCTQAPQRLACYRQPPKFFSLSVKTYPFFFIWARRPPLLSKILNFFTPPLCNTNFIVVASTPKPYFTLLRKFMDDASRKYFVGQLSSPILKLMMTSTIKLSSSESPSSRESIIGNSLINVLIQIGKVLSMPVKRGALKNVRLAIVEKYLL